MTGASLIRWSNLHEGRSGQNTVAQRCGILGVLLAGECTRRLLMANSEDLPQIADGLSDLWMTAAVSLFVLGVFLAPFRLYWRKDSKLLASLPIPGQSLYALALWRTHRYATWVSVSLLVAMAPIAILVDTHFALRHLIPLVIGFAGCAWLGPAAACGAGAIVASDKAQSMMANMGGDFAAPQNSWLGIIPGVTATSVAVAMIASMPFLSGQRVPGGSIVGLVGGAVLVAALAVLWSWRRADAVIPAAVREVSALDQEILAHVDRSTPSFLERSFSRMLLPNGAAQALAAKDASLSRRRYPSAYFLVPVGIATLWIIALTQPQNALPWATGISVGLLAYTVLMAKRATVAPIELPRLLNTLAISRRDASKTKLVQAILRAAVVAILGILPLLLRL